MTLEWSGPIEFIGLGPITPAGCGTRYEETVIRPQNCCEDATPIVWDSENSVEVLAPETEGWVFVTGGVPPYNWSVRGQGFTFDGRALRDAITDVPYIRVYASALACGYAPITVTDGCSVANGSVDATVGVLHGICSGVEFWGGAESVGDCRSFLGISWDGAYEGCMVGYGFYVGVHPRTDYTVNAMRWTGASWVMINGQNMTWENESLHAQMAAMPTKSINAALSGKPARITTPGDCFECWWSCT